jgi:hypothetical protein
MKLHILFGQRKQRYEGEYAPEVLTCWDEYAVEENPGGYEEDLAKQREKYGPEMTAMKVFVVKINGDEVVRRLNQDPVLKGEIEP